MAVMSVTKLLFCLLFTPGALTAIDGDGTFKSGGDCENDTPKQEAGGNLPAPVSLLQTSHTVVDSLSKLHQSSHHDTAPAHATPSSPEERTLETREILEEIGGLEQRGRGAPVTDPGLHTPDAAGSEARSEGVIGNFACLGAFAALSAATCGLYVRYGIFGAEKQTDEQSHAEASSPKRHAMNDDDLRSTDSNVRRGAQKLAKRSTMAFGEIHEEHRKWTLDMSFGTMGASEFIVNMFADLCPPGFLPLPYAMKNTGYIPGFVLLLGFYCLCVYAMWMISRVADMTEGGSTGINFADQWGKVISERTRWVPVAVVMLVCFGNALSYSCFFADIFTGVMPWLGFDMPRWQCLVMFTFFPALPLCFMKDLSALAPSSSFAVLSVVYTVVLMCVRALDGTYQPGGTYYDSVEADLIPLVPQSHLFGFGMPSLVLVNAMAMGFCAHYNGPKYYRELKNHSPSKMWHVTAIAMGISVLLFGVSMVAGFQTFGTNSEGVILKNYSRQDVPINIARLCMGFSIIASFPLMFSGLREATITFVKQFCPNWGHELDTVWKQDLLSVVLVAMITVCATILTDAGIVVGLVGSICGISIIYIVPSLLYAAAVQRYETDAPFYRVASARFLTVLGVLLVFGGAFSSLAY